MGFFVEFWGFMWNYSCCLWVLIVLCVYLYYYTVYLQHYYHTTTIYSGNTNTQVTAAIKQVADMYDVRPISGTLMHQMKQYVIDGKKMILLKELEPDQQKVGWVYV